MIINTIIPLNQIEALPSRQVGKLAQEFSKLATLKIKTSDGFVIPTETISQIAHHNNLFSKIAVIEESADWDNEFAVKTTLKKIKNLIAEQKIPTDIAQHLTKAAGKFDQKDIFLQIHTPNRVIENIQGDINLAESILEAWSHNYQKGQKPVLPILVLTQTQPDFSGVAKIDRQRKNIVIIKAVQGVYDKQLGDHTQPHSFEINLSTNTITLRQINPRKQLLKRKLDGYKIVAISTKNAASLTDDQANKIAEYCQAINRQFIGRRKFFFEVKNGKIIVTKLFVPSLKTNQDLEVILMGQSVTGGYIEGYTQIVNTIQEKNNFVTGSILVKKSLDHLDQELISKASAILIEDKSLTPTLLKIIHYNHVPCVIGVNFATTKLHSNQKIVVDAGAGKVTKSTIIASPVLETTTLTKVILSAGNPYKSEQYPADTEGIFLKSDYAIAYIGVHPNHLLRNQKDQFLDNLTRATSTFLHKTKHDFFYRACNLNSQELNSLKNSHNYEKLELNPYLSTRGALKILEDDTLFEAEIKVVSKLANQSKRTINFVLPWVRTSTELAILFKKIHQFAPNNSYLKFWLQLNTPANVFNLNEYLNLPIAGITVQAKTIHDLTYGIDPDSPDIERCYSFDHKLMTSMLENIAKMVKQSKLYSSQIDRTLPVVLKLNHFQAEMVNSATRLGLRAVVVKPSLFAIVKQQIIDTQNQLLK